jgi:hypothetical protein
MSHQDSPLFAKGITSHLTHITTPHPHAVTLHPHHVTTHAQARQTAACSYGVLTQELMCLRDVFLPILYWLFLSLFMVCFPVPLLFVFVISIVLGISSVCVRDDWNCFAAAAPCLSRSSSPSSSSSSSASSSSSSSSSPVDTDQLPVQSFSRVTLCSLPSGTCRWSFKSQVAVDCVIITSRGKRSLYTSSLFLLFQ